MHDTHPHANAPTDIAVIGAGVVGLATAYAATRRSLSVQILDAGSGPAQGASLANGAQLSYAYTDAMAGPSLWKQTPSLMLGLDPVFRMRLMGNPAIWRWGLQLMANANMASMHRNTLATLKLALESRDAMRALLSRHNIDFSNRIAGKMHLYFTEKAAQASASMIALKRPHGIVQELLDPVAAAEIEPALANIRGVAGVTYSPEEEIGDPHQFSVGLLDVLHREYDASAQFNFDLKDIRHDGKSWLMLAHDGRTARARKVVICAGIGSASIAKRVGIRIPLMAIKGYSFTAPCGPLAPSVSITDTSRKLVFCRLGDRMRVAGLADVNDWNPNPNPDRFAQLVALAQESMPDAVDYTRIEQPWAGLRPATPCSVPTIFSPSEGLIFNVGHGMLGWTLAMGSGERAIALATEKQAVPWPSPSAIAG